MFITTGDLYYSSGINSSIADKYSSKKVVRSDSSEEGVLHKSSQTNQNLTTLSFADLIHNNRE